MIVEEKFSVKAPIQKVWDFLLDPNQVGACVPGCEKIEKLDDKTYESVVKVKVGFITVKMKSKTKITEMEPPHHLKSVTEGSDMLKAGQVYQEAVMDIKEIGENEVEVSYKADTRVVGKLATFGEKIMRSKAKKMGEEFAKNIKKKLEA
ncbi:MAG: hypothetical protein DRG20_02420 [Deltaproteobacteria bacterium]|nr:MAG: hypothetical protein DRG20_02420 [Deltaproteobacteria bacterium]